MSRADPLSFADLSQPQMKHVSLNLYFDFNARIIRGSALITLSTVHSGTFVLDTHSLSIHYIRDPFHGKDIPFSFLSSQDPVLGLPLFLCLSSHSRFLVVFSTSIDSSALQWLPPSQTASKLHPFVYTQCHSIHARSIFPCQDTPAARLTFSARLNLPDPLRAVMAAARAAPTRGPLVDESCSACPNSFWCAYGRIVEEFVMDDPIPPYVFAFAVGKIERLEVGPRTCVYAEGGLSLLVAAAREFGCVENMIRAGEALFGPYHWGRFDLLVLPKSFLYGGMANPTMVFLTPTIIKGDATGAQMVARVLAQSWTGNLITNKTNEHFWLNVGLATYAGRRIVEVVQGVERAALNAVIGWKGLNDEMERFKKKVEFTKLKPNLLNVDPDIIYSQVPYEKGFQFLWRIERQIGRPAFDQLLKKYVATFKFGFIDTEIFLHFLTANVPGIENQIDLYMWVVGTRIPPDAMEPVSEIYTHIMYVANEFKLGRFPTEEEVRNWSGQEWELYIESLPKYLEAYQVAALDARYRLSESSDYDVKVAFLRLAISSGCKHYFGQVDKILKEVGRMKYLRPLYTALVNSSDGEKMIAVRIYAEARYYYHPIAQRIVQSILTGDS